MTRQLPGEALGRLGRHVDPRVWEEELPPSRDVLLAEAALAEGLVTLLTDRGDAGLLAAAAGPRAVSNVAVGYDNIDVPACTGRRTPVGHTPAVPRNPALLLAPHLASASHATRGRLASMAVDNPWAALEGQRPPHCMNPELFP